jgi:lipoyl(octanoyl) transferase
MQSWRVVDLGTRGYEQTRADQLELVAQRQRDEVPDTLLLVEHPHVFTLGRSRAAVANVVAPGDVPVIEIERGGDVTYHGPGQIVAYPIVLLRDGERDLHKFLRNLEEAVIRTCARFGLVADRELGKTGVWTREQPIDRRFAAKQESATPQLEGPPLAGTGTDERKKLCSMGIACRKWVTFHGLALNVTTDLAYFHRINPCGFDSDVMRSLASYVPAELAAVKVALAEELGTALARRDAAGDALSNI